MSGIRRDETEQTTRSGDARGCAADADRSEGWLARVREVYAPEPLDDVGRRRFDARLRARRAERAPRRWPLPAAAALAAAALAGLLALPGGPPGSGSGAPAPATVVSADPAAEAPAEAWEHDLFVAADAARGDDLEADLPDEYAAIAYAFDMP